MPRNTGAPPSPAPAGLLALPELKPPPPQLARVLASMRRDAQPPELPPRSSACLATLARRSRRLLLYLVGLRMGNGGDWLTERVLKPDDDWFGYYTNPGGRKVIPHFLNNFFFLISVCLPRFCGTHPTVIYNKGKRLLSFEKKREQIHKP